jgi:hypothetical protein
LKPSFFLSFRDRGNGDGGTIEGFGVWRRKRELVSFVGNLEVEGERDLKAVF